MKTPQFGSPAETGSGPTVQDAFAFMRRRRGVFVLIALPIVLGAILLAYKLPPVYRSDATILIEQPAIPEDIVPSLVTSYVDERIQAVTQRVMAAENVRAIMEEFDLYSDLRDDGLPQQAVTAFRADVYQESISAEVYDPRRGRMDGSTYAFVIGFHNESPEVAQSVAAKLAQAYVDENTRSRTERSAETTGFLADSAERMAAEMSEMEAKMADYKGTYAEAMPERLQLNVQVLERTERELDDIEKEIRQLSSERDLLQLELQSIDPYAIVFSEGNSTMLNVSERLEELQLEYIRLKSLYGDAHPDVIRTKREIDAIVGEKGGNTTANLSQQLAELQLQRDALLDRYSAEHPDVQRLDRAIASIQAELRAQPAGGRSVRREPTNPLYIQKQLALNTATTALSAAQAQRNQLRTRLDNVERNIAIAPRVEREWLELVRGYDSARQEYNQLQSRISDARMSERLETQNKAERFTLLERASLPAEPLEPNRPAIVFLGVVLALGAGIGMAALVDGMDSTVRSFSDLEALLASAPLVAIPYMATSRDVRARRMKNFFATSAFVVSIALVVYWL